MVGFGFGTAAAASHPAGRVAVRRARESRAAILVLCERLKKCGPLAYGIVRRILAGHRLPADVRPGI